MHTSAEFRPRPVGLALLSASVLLTLLALVQAPAIAAASCGPVETLPDEGHAHLLSGAEPPVPYRSVPPTSGWHYTERDEIHFGVVARGEALSEVHQVSVLAVGGVVVTYLDLDPDDVAEVAEIVAAEVEAGRPVALTPYDELEPGQVALTAWNLRQLCDGVDREAVASFVDEHAVGEPDFDMDDHDDGTAATTDGEPGEDAGAVTRDGSAGAGAGPVAIVAAGAALVLFTAAAVYALRRRGGRRGVPPH